MTQYKDINVTSRLLGISVAELRRGVKDNKYPHKREGSLTRGKLLFELQSMALILATDAQHIFKEMDTKYIDKVNEKN